MVYCAQLPQLFKRVKKARLIYIYIIQKSVSVGYVVTHIIRHI